MPATSKVDGNAHEPLSQRARATIQADVDRLYAEFCGLVAANRGLTAEAVRGTNAAVYRGELAVRAGLADRVGTLDARDCRDGRRARPRGNARPQHHHSHQSEEEPVHGDERDRTE